MDLQYTGNTYVFVPHIDSRGGVRAVNVVHRGLDGIVEWRAGDDRPLAGLEFRLDGAPVEPEDVRWERLDGWIPQMEARLGRDLRISLTICAPTGYEALARGVILRFEVQNRGSGTCTLDVALAGTWCWAVRCVGSTRPMHGGRRLVASPRGDGFALEVGEGAIGASLAIVAGGGGTLGAGIDQATADGAVVEHEAASGEPLSWRIERSFQLAGRRRAGVTFAIAAGLERDGALHTASRLAQFDAARIVQDARIEATRIGRHSVRGTGDRLRDNLLFTAYAGVARAIDDDRLYPVASRILDHGPCAVVDELDILLGTVPALSIAEPVLARELLLRMFELYSDRAGTHFRYLAGGVHAPGFSLTRFCAYMQGVDAYIVATRDGTMADEPIIQDVMREMDEWLWGRLDHDIFLCTTDLGPSGQQPDYPFTITDNVRAWRFARAIEMYLKVRDGDPPARFGAAAEDFATAIWQHGVVDHGGSRVFAGSVDLQGNAAIYDDPEGSLRWLPYLGFCEADDPIWTDTMDLFYSKAYPLWRGGAGAEGLTGRDTGGAASFAALCAEALTPRRPRAIETLASLALPGGIACRTYDPDTAACATGPWSASHAGLFAWTLLDEQRRKEPAPRKR